MGVADWQTWIPLRWQDLRWQDYFEIAVLFVAIYLLLRVVKDTAAGTMLRGALTLAFIAIVGATVVFQALELHVLNALLEQLLGALVVALLIVFQPELRRGLLSLGERRFFGSHHRRDDCRHALTQAVSTLSRSRTGALFAIERSNHLPQIVETGVELDAEARSELIRTIFWRDSPLHDGGMVLRGRRIVAAGCIFPLTERRDLASRFGTRHRAGLGMSEQSDAVVVIVSEETGSVSVAVDGNLNTLDDPAELLGELDHLLDPDTESPSGLRSGQAVVAADDAPAPEADPDAASSAAEDEAEPDDEDDR